MFTRNAPIRFLLLFAITCVPFIAAAQEEQPKPTGNSIISGRVIYADTGRPVRRATVLLYTNVNRSPRRTTPANARGEFRFNEVEAGAYFVVADAPGIVSPTSAFSLTEFGIAGNQETEYTRVTVDGKSASRCEIKAVRAGVIKGTATYDDKEPVVNARVVIYRRKSEAIAPFLVDPVTTNDRGMYRIDGLPDGEYFIGLANGEMAPAGAGNSPRELPSPVNAFYPGVRTLAEAKPIQVQAGTEVNDADMTLNDDMLRAISGIVKWRGSGDRITEGGLTLRRKDDPRVDLSFSTLMRAATQRANDDDEAMFAYLPVFMMSMPAATKINENGEWRFADLPPGTYLVTAFAQLRERRASQEKSNEKDAPAAPPSTEPDRAFVSRQVEVTVDQEDVEKITIELSEGGRLLGVVVGEDSPPAAPVVISVNRKGVDSFMLNMPQSSKPDGTFMVEGVPAGEVLLDVDVNPRGDQYLKSITTGSQDLMREPLRMEEGAEVTGVRITLGTGLATVAGVARVSEGESPAAGAGILLVRSDPELWHLESLRAFATAGANGAFNMRCPPGEYLLFTWEAGNRPLQRIEDYVRAHAANARRITLQSKEEKQMDLTITTKGTKDTKGTKEEF